MRDGEPPAAWLFLSPDAVPEQWRSRARPAMYVPLLPDETKDLLAARPVLPSLSARDEHVARLAATGRTSASIARELGVSRRTVDRRLAALRDQFGVTSSAELAVRLSAHGLAMTPEPPPVVGGQRSAPPNSPTHQAR